MDNTDINIKRKEFLDDMVKYYSEDTSRRATAISTSGYPTCYYKTHDEKKCAIGRYIPSDKYDEIIEGKLVIAKIVIQLLPDEIVELGADFLTNVQTLHDTNIYWNRYGLSESGKLKIADIIETYCKTENTIKQ